MLTCNVQRWFMICMGILAFIMFFLRFVVFTIFESPKYLMGRGRDEDAVKVVHEVARRNGKTSSLTVEDLQVHERGGQQQQTDAKAALSRKLQKLNLTHVRALFASPKLAISTSMIMAIWGFIGLGG